MWSHEVSAATGSFTQQVLMQNAYASQINPYSYRNQAEFISGNLINRGIGFATPIAKFVGGLAGLDSPLSGALTWGGVGAMVGGPVGAGIGAGLGAIVGTAGAFAQFGAGQVVTGMQQQQALNAMLRQNYGFLRPGGYGFSGVDAGIISSQIRAISHEVGPGGEMHSFSELAQLASNMGRMGFAQNITDVRQFTQKFKQMVDTVKTVAKELGTTLQSAQEMIVGLRQSGIFSTADQIRMAQGIRANSLAGISMEASSQMANIGSQIARSIGGLGRSGAFAGMRTIQQIGAAVRTGALTEEDIYNATGLTGEQGQMALAQNQLQSSAWFLRSSRGRYLLASLAGSNGQLDERAAQEFMYGGFGVGRTRELAYQNLGRIGRANFIRNEGRLRGEVLNRFGGNVNTLALIGWAAERGIDISAMGDREMLFAQRMLGMGRDELDVAVKQANAMGDIGSYMDRQRMQDDYLRDLSIVRKNTGLEGVKNTFNRFRERAQSKVQEYGSKVYQDVTNVIERKLNEMFGVYTREIDAQLDDAYTRFAASGGMDYVARERVQRAGAIARSGFQSPAGMAIGGQMSLSQYQKLAQGGGAAQALGALMSPTALLYTKHNLWVALGGLAYRMLGGETLEDKTGFHFKYNPNAGGTEEEQFKVFQDTKAAFMQGANLPIDKGNMWIANELSGILRTAGAGQAMGNAVGMDRAQLALKYAAEQGSPVAAKLQQLMSSGRPEDAKLAASILNSSLARAGQMGINAQSDFMNQFGAGGYATEQDRIRAMGNTDVDLARAAGSPSALDKFIAFSAAPNVLLHGFALKYGANRGLDEFTKFAFSANAALWAAGKLGLYTLGDTGAQKQRDELGKIYQSQEGKEKFFAAMGGGGALDKAREEWNRLQSGTKEQRESAEAEFAKLRVVAGTLGKEELLNVQEQIAKTGKFTLSKEAKERMRREFGKGMSEGDMRKYVLSTLGAAQSMTGDSRQQLIDEFNKQSEQYSKEFASYTRSGVYTETGELSAAHEKWLREKGLGTIASASSAKGKRLYGLSNIRMLGSATADDIAAAQQRFEEAAQSDREALRGVSAKQLMEEARRTLSLTESGPLTDAERASDAAQAMRNLQLGKSFATAQRTVTTYGGGLAAGKWMGLNMDVETQRALYNARGDVAKQVGMLSQLMGLGEKDTEQRKELEIQLRRMSGKPNLGYSEEDLNRMSEEDRKRILDIAKGDKGMDKGMVAFEARQKLAEIAREREKERKRQEAEDDPNYKAISELTKQLTQLVSSIKSDKDTVKTVRIDGPVQISRS
jgi:hypothetical protein